MEAAMKALKRFGPLVFSVLAGIYLGYWGLEGEQGYINHARIMAQAEAVEAELAETRTLRQRMERRAASLDDRPDSDSFDVDYLEERARAVLRFAHPDELVVTIDARPH